VPTFRHGKLTNFQINDIGGNNRDISNVARECNLIRDADTAETSAFGTQDKTFVVGLVGRTFDVSGMFDATVDGYLNGILGQDIAAPYTGVFIYGPEGSATGRVKYTGAALCIAYNDNNVVNDMASFTASFQVTGAVTRGVF
jgi:hypothetical protein